MASSWRPRIADVLGEGDGAPGLRRPVSALLVTAVTASVVAAVLETVPGPPVPPRLLSAVEYAAVALLTLEYLLRTWVAPERDPRGAARPWIPRLRYLRSPHGVIDALAVLPVYLHLVVPLPADWYRVLRLLRLLKMARHAPGLSLFAAVVRNERRALLAGLLVMVVLLVVAAGIMYALEREAQPVAFASIPHALWWAIVTLGTVGYGDVVPVTAAGRLVSGMVMILGIAMFAVPAGILAHGFASEIHKRDFVVTWRAVARVPLFSTLDAGRIAEIAGMLKRQVVPAHHVIVRRGGPGDALVFIMGGEVEVDVAPHPVRLGPGQYFGEIALLRDSVRTATVTSLTECQLLVLEVADFRRLLEAHPDLKATIIAMAERRLRGDGGRDLVAGPVV